MPTRYLAAAVQMHSGDDKARNLETAARLVKQAAARGARVVVLPEYFNFIASLEAMAAAAEPLSGASGEAMRSLARELGIFLQAGSICEISPTPGRAYNTSLLFSPAGELLAAYRKLHLFDVDIPGQITNRESQWIAPGDSVLTTPTPLGTLGHATCYDLRFPELFRRLTERGMQVLAFPSAFSAPTGRAHWETLLRARAIENQVYVVAANQFGRHTPAFASYGHSLIVDPWGEILAAAQQTEAVLMAEIDLDRLAQVRRQLPCLEHRRNL